MKTKATQKTWDLINELTNIKRRSNVQPSKLTLNNYDTVSEPQIIAEEFNRFFVNIGKEMAASFQPNDSNSAECSVGEKKKITNSIFLLPSCQQEVFNLIKELKNRKATRTLDIETKFIKLANLIISFFLSELFNLCLRRPTGTYPDLMKVAEVQRWSRGHKARGQGHKKKPRPRPRPRTAFPRTDTLEAKDRNARGQGQGPRTQAQVLSKITKIF